MTTKQGSLSAAILFLFLGAASGAWAQGVQMATVTGVVRDASGLVLPGVTVTATSPALQQGRTGLTDGNGVYTIPGLPAGQYSVQFVLAGMRSVEATQRVALGQPARVDASMQLEQVTESVQVTAAMPTVVSSVQGGANYRTDDIGKLAAPRTIAGIAELAPGLTDNTPNVRQVTIGGGFAYDNQFLMDGVDIADNLLGQPNDLFIEDAIEEVQVLTSGISAEFGRFGGGVVNAITKSGGNDFHSTLRVNFYSPSWTTETPFEKTAAIVRQKDVQQNYEATLGGPLLRNRLWFFGAGRWQDATTPTPFPDTGIPFSTVAKNRRYEVKMTGTLVQNHTLQVTSLSNNSETLQPAVPGASIDPRTVLTASIPNRIWAASYRGVLRSNLYGSLQASRRTWSRDAGGTEADILRSPFFSIGATSGVPAFRFYNAPYFDASDPEGRNNRQLTGSLNWFHPTRQLGSHDVKVGYERFTSTRTGGNSQSATGFVFRSDYALAGSRPQLDGQGRLVPLFVPGVSRLENWLPTRGAQIDITTTSLYVQDHWMAGSRWTLDLGTRFELVGSDATGGIATVDARTIVPRLGVGYDVTGQGTWIAQATYGHYAGKYSEAQFAANTDVGISSWVTYQYSGPAGQGVDFAPGFDRANYTQIVDGGFPTANIVLDETVHSPLTKEMTLSLGTPIGRRGSAKATYQWRTITGMVEDFIDDPTASGRVDVVRNGRSFGTFNRIVYRNSDVPVRDYQALAFQADHRLTSRWRVDGHWTLQLRNHGNYEGEAANQPGLPSLIGNFPEIYALDRNNPEGRLDDFQRHKVRLWTTYSLGLAAFGTLDVGALYRYDSPLTFSLLATAVPLSAAQRSSNPGYAVPPASQTVYFGERGTEEYQDSHLVDMALTYSMPVWRELRPWVKVELFNLFNNQNLVLFNTQVTRNAAGPVDSNGLPTEYIRGARFGQATALTHFPRSAQNFAGQSLYARTFLLSTGFRF